LKFQADAPILEKLKSDSEQELRIEKLEKELFEQKLIYAEHQRKLILLQEESKVREEALIKNYNNLKEAMEKQSDKTNNMIQEMMKMMKKQAKP